MIYHAFLGYIEPSTDLPTWLVVLLFVVPFGGGLFFYFYKTRHVRSWRKGIFPQSTKFNQDNLLEAYLALGAILILLDRQKTKGHTQFINRYFSRYFTMENYNFGDSLVFSLQHPIQLDSISQWLNLHLDSEGKKTQVVYFLTGLAYLNESLSQNELKFLQLMNEKLGLPKENLLRIIAIFQNYHSQQKKSDKNEDQKRSRAKDPLIIYRQILGVDASASIDEIKKSYRSLVKLHHPDVFAQSSEAQQKMAEEKFVQIQEAYEQLISK